MPYHRQSAPVLPAAHELAATDSITTGLFRHVAESFILLAIAVALFRGFFAEGFMISTGSMAPALLGYHRRVVCPECHFQFARGAAVETEQDYRRIAQGSYDIGLQDPPLIRCPSCAFTDIAFQELPRTEGDQLLVHKHAYEFRDPRRWEVIVFRNPDDPREAYVKRVAGLPGEQIEIRDGEVFANGILCRKPLETQRGMKVPVSRWENQTLGTDPDARSGWVSLEKDSCWRSEGASLSLRSREFHPETPIDWISYRHWGRAGGQHESVVPLAEWPREAAIPKDSFSPLSYRSGELAYVGIMTDVERRTWLSRADDPAFHDAMNRLYEKSHLVGVVDESGYNAVDEAREHPVDEFFLSLTLKDLKGTGRFEIQLRDTENVFTAVIDFGQKECRLLRNDELVQQTSLPDSLNASSMDVEFSLFDNQALLALNGDVPFPPFQYETMETPQPVSQPVRFGAAQLDCTVHNVNLSRDVYYVTRTEQGPGNTVLADNEFYVLGDNSPVSVDSRVWAKPGVPRRALIGKPLVVHLPSSSCRVVWNGTPHDFRIPDFSRARLIR
ncbi:MAG TPA: signal peptidase I [Planctomicrobium sp.]|nr:signal peptidase I [Planctomicrobium sp.]